MTLIDGKKVAQELKMALRAEVEKGRSLGHKTPHLAAVLVGENPASMAYVNNKVKSCADAGFKSTLIKKQADISQDELIAVVKQLNEDPDIDGFIVQLPLPKHIDELTITMAIDPAKDVDGFHPVNFGKMAQGLPCFLPATPYGITLLLQHYHIDTIGKNAVVVGRSHIVGTPMSILLSRKGSDATVTLTHSRTKDLKSVVAQADIVIAAIGIPGFITADMVKEGAVVIDVGINRVEDDTAIKGYKLVGDVDFDHVAPKCSFITPVPGGVGPMTVVSLMKNTFLAAQGKK